MKSFKNFIKVCKTQNIRLVKKKLSIQTFSNVSIRIDRKYFTIWAMDCVGFKHL